MIMRIALIFAVALLALSFVAASQLGNVSKSDTHKPTYVNTFTRFYATQNVTSGYKITINYTKVPRILQGRTPQLQKPRDLDADKVNSSGRIIMDPRTCPNDIAYCYQVRTHNGSKATAPGKNYTAVSTYVLPQSRIKSFVCVGDDIECVQSATHCYCPKTEVPPPPIVWPNSKCSDTTHLCLNSFGSFKLCEGNITQCREQYNLCGCGRRAACVSEKNTCINERNELTLCSAALPDCLARFKTCYCGNDMMELFQKGCSTSTHLCQKNNKTFTCYGKFEGCALQADRCEC
jgi:hypothetical protein